MTSYLLFALVVWLFIALIQCQQTDWTDFSPSLTRIFTYSAPKTTTTQQFSHSSNSSSSFNQLASFWVPINIEILDYGYWIVNPIVIGTIPHFNLCDTKSALLQKYNLSSCEEAFIYWNETKQVNRTLVNLIDDFQVPLYMKELGDWYLFDMCAYCENTTTYEQLEIAQSVFQNSSLATLWKNSCGGADNLLVYSHDDYTVCYCSQQNIFAASCNSFQLFWVPLFFFAKDIFYFVILGTIILLSVFLIIIPRFVHICKETLSRRSLTKKEQCTSFLSAVFTNRNAIIFFSELCYLSFMVQLFAEVSFHWVNGFRILKILPRALGCTFWFCSSVTMLNIWIKSVVESSYMKEPKWSIALRIIISIVPYIPIILIIIIMFIVSYATGSAINITFGAAYLLCFSYIVMINLLDIIIGAILFCNLKKVRKDIHLCSLRFTKYLFFSLFMSILVALAFIHEGLNVILGDFTGEVLYMYNILFVDIIMVLAATPYMYAAFSFTEWLQCYRLCCPTLPRSFSKKQKQEPSSSVSSAATTPTHAPLVNTFEQDVIPQELTPQEEQSV